jgi:hypothetical protein
MAIPSSLTLMGVIGAEQAIRMKAQVLTTAVRHSVSFFIVFSTSDL